MRGEQPGLDSRSLPVMGPRSDGMMLWRMRYLRRRLFVRRWGWGCEAVGGVRSLRWGREKKAIRG